MIKLLSYNKATEYRDSYIGSLDVRRKELFLLISEFFQISYRSMYFQSLYFFEKSISGKSFACKASIPGLGFPVKVVSSNQCNNIFYQSHPSVYLQILFTIFFLWSFPQDPQLVRSPCNSMVGYDEIFFKLFLRNRASTPS